MTPAMTPARRLAVLIRSRRRALGVSQGHLARLMGVGQSSVARWELGERTPSGFHMLQLCRLLRISYDEVL
jgi:transcriptional regulator with XRE-family HTH domain